MSSNSADNIIKENAEVNIFGNGAVFRQIKPLLDEWKVSINKVYDDKPTSGLRVSESDGEPLLYCVGYTCMVKRGMRFNQIKSKKKMVSLIAKRAILSPTAKIGEGVIIYQGCVIDHYCTIHNNVLLNIGVMIAHDACIGENVYISPGAVICGNVQIGEGVFIGANATIIDGVTVGPGAVVAAGAVVIDHVRPYTMVAGCPANEKKILIGE